MALVRFARGTLASVVNSALSPRQETHLRIDYQHATVELTHLYGYTRDSWRFTPAPGPQPQTEALLRAWEDFPPDTAATHGTQLASYLADLDAGQRPLTSGEEARRTLELLTALYKSAFTGQPVLRGSIQPGDPFYARLHGGLAPPRAGGAEKTAGGSRASAA